MRSRKSLFFFSSLIILSTIGTGFYIVENLIVVLEQASLLGVRPVRHKIPKDLIYREIVYDPRTSSKLDIYRQPRKTHERLYPVLIFIPGGLWQGHNKKNYAHIAGLAHKEDMVAVVVQLPVYYGFITRHLYTEETLASRRFHPQREGLKKALLWVLQNIEKYKGDPKNLILMGLGSGAQLVGSLALLPEAKNQETEKIKKSIKKMVFLSPILDPSKTNPGFHEEHISQVFRGTDLKQLSLLREGIRPDMPLLLLSPEQDFPFLHEQAKIFSKRHPQVERHTIKNTSRKTLVFKLGRKDLATRTLIDFLR